MVLPLTYEAWAIPFRWAVTSPGAARAADISIEQQIGVAIFFTPRNSEACTKLACWVVLGPFGAEGILSRDSIVLGVLLVFCGFARFLKKKV